MKKILAIMLGVIIAMSQMCFAASENSDIQVYIDGYAVEFEDSAPCIINSRTMVPMRAIFEALDTEVQWSVEQQKITAEKDGKKITLFIGKKDAEVDGESVKLDEPPVIIDSRTVVPARFISEALGAKVEWNDKRKTVYIWTINPELLASIREFEKLANEDFIRWMASLYDVESGSFYYSVSSRDNAGFAPTIESANWLIRDLKVIGILPNVEVLGDEYEVPEKFKQGMLNYLIPLQNEEDGYFYEPQYGKSVSEAKRTRDTVAENLIKYFGGQCKYATPAERVSATSQVSEQEADPEATPDVSGLVWYLQSRENFKEWLETLDIDGDPYTVGSKFSTSLSMVTRLGYMDLAIDFRVKKQNQNTGVWGGDNDKHGIDGALKVVRYFNENTIPYPNIDKMVETVLRVTNEEEITEDLSMAHNWNRIAVIDLAMKSYDKIDPALQAKIDEALIPLIKRTSEKLLTFYKQPDHGYSYYMSGSSVSASDAVISLGLKEGEASASTLCFDCWKNACSLAGIGEVPFEHMEEYRDLFWSLIENAKPIDKPQFDMDYYFNFDGKLPVVSVRGREFTGYVAGDKIYFSVVCEEARGAELTRNYMVGKENFFDEMKKMPVVKSGGEVTDDVVTKTDEGVYTIKLKDKTYEAYVQNSIVQVFSPFEGVLNDSSKGVRRCGLPKWHTGVFGANDWNWVAQRFDSSFLTSIEEDEEIGGKVFRLEKTVATKNASFQSSNGAPESGIKSVVANFKMKIDDLSAFYDEEFSSGFYFGGSGGQTPYTGRHAIVLTREGKNIHDRTMDVKYMKNAAQSTKIMPLETPVKLLLGKWYDFSLFHINEENSDGTYTGTTRLYIDGDLALEVSDIYTEDYSLNATHTGFFGFSEKGCGPTTYTVCLDDYKVEFVKGESETE